MSTQIAALASAVVLVAAAGRASAELDATIAGGNLVTGTIAAPGATETFRVTCPAGAALNVTVKGVKKKGATTPAATFVVKDEDSFDVGSDRIVRTATGASAKAIPLSTTAVYRIVVSAGAGTTGDFQLAATWKSPAAPPVSGDLTGGEATFVFDADAGAVVNFDVSQAPKSTALPRLDVCTGPDFAHSFVAPAIGAKRHRANGVVLPATG